MADSFRTHRTANITATSPIMPTLPTYLINLRQFWQFVRDCKCLANERACTLADVGRMFTFACREEEIDGLDTIADEVPPKVDEYSYRLRVMREQLGMDSTEKLPRLADELGRWKVRAHRKCTCR